MIDFSTIQVSILNGFNFFKSQVLLELHVSHFDFVDMLH